MVEICVIIMALVLVWVIVTKDEIHFRMTRMAKFMSSKMTAIVLSSSWLFSVKRLFFTVVWMTTSVFVLV
jgi:hypothetical protein